MSTQLDRYLESAAQEGTPVWLDQMGHYYCFWKNCWWLLEETDNFEEGRRVWLLQDSEGITREIHTVGGSYTALDMASAVIAKLSS